MVKDDPIASDPALMWVWTRYIGILIALLAFALGASSDAVDLSGLSTP